MLESTDIRKIVRLNGMAHVLQVLLGFALSCIILPQFYIRKSHVYFFIVLLKMWPIVFHRGLRSTSHGSQREVWGYY